MSQIRSCILSPLSGKLQDWAELHGLRNASFCLMDAAGEAFSRRHGTQQAESSLFLLGSQSKVLTAFGVAEALAQRGVRLGQPISEWWRSASVALPSRFCNIDALALLSHRSGGFRSERQRLRRPDGRHMPRAVAVSYHGLRAHLSTYEGSAGHRASPFVYSDIAYGLLALALREAFGVSLETLVNRLVARRHIADVFSGLRFVPDHRLQSLVSGSLRGNGCRITLKPKDLGALNPALGCVASAEGLTRVYQGILADDKWRRACVSNAKPIRPDRRYPLYSSGLTHFRCNRGGPDILGHVGIYHGCTGATLHHPGLRVTASLQLDRIDLESRVRDEHRMIFPERFLLALFQLIADAALRHKGYDVNIDAVLAQLAG